MGVFAQCQEWRKCAEQAEKQLAEVRQMYRDELKWREDQYKAELAAKDAELVEAKKCFEVQLDGAEQRAKMCLDAKNHWLGEWQKIKDELAYYKTAPVMDMFEELARAKKRIEELEARLNTPMFNPSKGWGQFERKE